MLKHNTIRKAQPDELNKFKSLGGQRSINLKHVERLIKSRSLKDVQYARPVLINENNEIVEGQHTIEAAKRLNMPVYYILVKDAGIEETQVLNANVRPWQLQDFLNSYSLQGREEYIAIRDLTEKYDLPISLVIKIIDQRGLKVRYGEVADIFKSGDIKTDNLSNAITVFDQYIMFKKNLSKRLYRQRAFFGAFVKFRNIDDYDHKRMVKSIAKFSHEIRYTTVVADYINQFLNLYNHGKQKRAIIDIKSL